jgi:hypothetical protein
MLIYSDDHTYCDTKIGLNATQASFLHSSSCLVLVIYLYFSDRVIVVSQGCAVPG